MSTKILVPRASGEGGIGSSDKAWDNGYFNTGHFNEDIYISGVPIAFALEEAGVGGKWEDSTSAGDIYYSAGKVGIGSILPATNLQVKGLDPNGADPAETSIGLSSFDGTQNAAIRLLNAATNTQDRLAISVGSFALEQMTILNNGNVGIGTTSPNTNLDVKGSMRIERDGSSPLIQFTDTNIDSRWIGMVDGTRNFSIYGTDGTTQELTIRHDGNVGIGDNDPNVKLSVRGENADIYLRDSAGVGSVALVQDANGYGKVHIMNNVGNNLISLNSDGDSYISSGKLGIGGGDAENNPVGILHIEGASATPGIIYNSGTETDVLNLKIGVKTEVNGAWVNKEGLSVTNQDGKVGIRTEVPADQLEIWTKNASTALSIYNEVDADRKFTANVYDNGGILSLLNDDAVIIQIDGRVGTPNFTWFNGGKVVIGKSFAGITDSVSVPRFEVDATQGASHPGLRVNAKPGQQAYFNATAGRFCQVNWTSDTLSDRTWNNGGVNTPANFRNGYISLDLGVNGNLAEQFFVIGVADAWINNDDGLGVYDGIVIRCASSTTNSFIFKPGGAGNTNGFLECLGGIQILNGSAIEMSSGSDIQMLNGSTIEFDTPNAILSAASTGAATGALYIGNQSITTSSDIRIKKNIEDSKVNALDILGKIRIVDFEWDEPTDTSFNNRNVRGRWTGFIAQEAIEHFPTLINAPRKEEDLSIDTESELTWGVDQAAAIPMLIKAIQEQQSIIDELKAEIQALKSN
jgi:hypothetical protein